MQRRDFLRYSMATGLSACSSFPWPRPEVTILRPGMAGGHRLRDGPPPPDPARSRACEVVIVGGGVAGLFAGWRLAQEGFRDFLLIGGPEPHGNAAGGHFGALSYPRGAHYLPLPTPESLHVREMLASFGILRGDPADPRPYYDEAALVHAPEERLLLHGTWQEGMVPAHGLSEAGRAQIERFLRHMARMRAAHGTDGRRAFSIPLVLSSRDPESLALDGETFEHWLQRNDYTDPALRWYANYCCRDDYGAGIERVSAWAGIHYFASRGGHASNAEDGAVLTWPDGLATLAARLARDIGTARVVPGFAARLRENGRGVEVLCLDPDGRTGHVVLAKRAIVAMPLHVAARVVEGLRAYGFDPATDLPPSAPWMVSNFLLDGFPPERGGKEGEVPLAWDNVVYRGLGLGWVVSTHQLIRQARPEQTVFSAYHAFSAMTPTAARQWMLSAPADEMLALAASDMVSAYGRSLWQHAQRVEITLRGHAMASPEPGFLSRRGPLALRERDGRVLFAHADLSGLSVFEEAAWWGDVAARKVLA